MASFDQRVSFGIWLRSYHSRQPPLICIPNTDELRLARTIRSQPDLKATCKKFKSLMESKSFVQWRQSCGMQVLVLKPNSREIGKLCCKLVKAFLRPESLPVIDSICIEEGNKSPPPGYLSSGYSHSSNMRSHWTSHARTIFCG